MKTIKFSRCPIGKHRGERWPKLARIDVSKPIILDMMCIVKDPFDMGKLLEFWASDMFPDTSLNDILSLMERFYGIEKPALIILYFTQGNVMITTARAYEWRKHKYYLDCIGQEFMVVEPDSGDYPEDCIKQDNQGYCDARGKLMIIPCRKRSCPDYLPPQRPEESEGRD